VGSGGATPLPGVVILVSIVPESKIELVDIPGMASNRLSKSAVPDTGKVEQVGGEFVTDGVTPGVR
jgi:hypothetical protein